MFALTLIAVAAAVLVWAVMLQQTRRDPLAPARRALTKQEQTGVLRAIERARAEGDAEALAEYEQMWRDIQRNNTAAGQQPAR